MPCIARFFVSTELSKLVYQYCGGSVTYGYVHSKAINNSATPFQDITTLSDILLSKEILKHEGSGPQR